MKLAGAPISWGVCEVPEWGLQLPADRVLADMQALGLAATEAGPPGFLPTDPFGARAMLQAHGLGLVAGFVTAVLHDQEVRATELASLKQQASWLASIGAEVLVLAAATGRTGYSATDAIDEAAWSTLFTALDEAASIAVRHSLRLAVHPHFGTVIERMDHIDRFLDGCGHGLCLDTGHLVLGGADPVRVAEHAGDRVVHVHLKDVDGDLGARVRDGTLDYAPAVRRGLYCTLGDGSARIGEVLALLRARGYSGWHVLEQDVRLDAAPAGIPPWIERGISFARARV